jgi:mono/diheme cytochrome c family protein
LYSYPPDEGSSCQVFCCRPAAALERNVASGTAEDGREEDPNAPVSYFKRIRPIFQAQCQGCHQPAKAKGGYVMTDFAKLLTGGESAADGEHAIIPKDPAKSLLVKQITPARWLRGDAAEEGAALS